MQYQQKEREVYCEYCKKYYLVKELPNPICCEHSTVTVISKSLEPLQFPSFQYVDKLTK